LWHITPDRGAEEIRKKLYRRWSIPAVDHSGRILEIPVAENVERTAGVCLQYYVTVGPQKNLTQ
jgi:hypothetical protein